MMVNEKRTSRRGLILAFTMALLAGACGEETRSARLSDDARFVRETYTEVNSLNQPTSGSSAQPQRFESRSSRRTALIAQLGVVDYNHHTLPLISPDGKYLVVQEGSAPNWETVLAEQGAPIPPFGSIVIYRIEKNEQTRRLALTVHKRLDDVGLLGRNADANGFLIESPRTSGSARWIGQINWETGELKWLVRGSSINAFAAVHTDGRVAWCRRDTNDGRFHLIIQGEGTVLRLPAVNGDWLMPAWAEDGRTLFAFFLHDSGALDLVALDRRSEDLLARPIVTKRLLDDATVRSAYQCLAPIQNPQARDGSARLLFFHPGSRRMAIADVERDGVRLLGNGTIAGTWHDHDTFVLAGMDALYRMDGDDPVANPPVSILKGVAVPRRTNSELLPYLLICPSKEERNKLYLWAMDLLDDPSRARENLPNKKK